MIPTLTKIVRPGPGRQRVAKGYVVEAGTNAELMAALLSPRSAPQSKAKELGFTLRGSRHALFIDTGLVWLHTTAERERLCQRLIEVVRETARATEARGGRLLPGAFRFAPATSWDELVCGDEHFIETSSEREKTVFCNLVRYYLPELIALTGRAGASPSGVEQLGSRRLADSQRHVPARAFASLDSRYLPHLMKSLARDERVPSTSLLDVDPRVGEGADANPMADRSVELRFVDAQVTIRSTMAHAILFQALLIRARRLTAEGKAVPAYEQQKFERDRVRAIQYGLQAQFVARDVPSARAQGSRAAASRAPLVPASQRVLELLDDLTFEFRALGVIAHQLLPIAMGVRLRQWALLSDRNENDLLQSELARESSGSVEQRIQSLIVSDEDRLTLANQRFKSQARDVRREWDERLRVEPKPVDEILRAPSPGPEQGALP